MAPRLEISAFSLTSAQAAVAHAHRIELCAGPRSTGGLTPSASDYVALRAATSLPIYVMLRPHHHSFSYTSSDLATISTSVSAFQALPSPPDGFVFGILTSANTVDVAACRAVVEHIRATNRDGKAQPCTFHRAFDDVAAPDRKAALEDLVRLGFAAVLTGGGPAAVAANVDGLRDTIVAAAGRIDVLAGGGVRSANVTELADRVGAQPAFWHSAAMLEDGDAAEAVPDEVQRLRALVDGLTGEDRRYGERL